LIVIEFFGLPAVGKTTIVNKLLADQAVASKSFKQLQHANNKIFRLVKNFLFGSWVLKKHSFRLVHLFFSIDNRSRTKLINIIIKIGILNNLRVSHLNETVVCDQLVLQDLWSILVHEPLFELNDIKWLLSFYVRKFVGPNVRVIYMKRDLDIVKSQYLTRSENNDIFKGTNETELDVKMQKSHKIMCEIVSYLPEQHLKVSTDYNRLVEYINEN
jgi:hypothetical protein